MMICLLVLDKPYHLSLAARAVIDAQYVLEERDGEWRVVKDMIVPTAEAFMVSFDKAKPVPVVDPDLPAVGAAAAIDDAVLRAIS